LLFSWILTSEFWIQIFFEFQEFRSQEPEFRIDAVMTKPVIAVCSSPDF
jgi:hypothetical protein